MTHRVSSNQAAYLRYLASNPGASTADVDRACRWNERAGHKWVYDGVKRLRRRGFVAVCQVRPESARGGAVGLELTAKGREALS